MKCQCQYCNKILSSKSALTSHQKLTRYCLKIQGKSDKQGDYDCLSCGKNFLNNNTYKYHQKAGCNENNKYTQVKNLLDEEKINNEKFKEKIIELENIISTFNTENMLLKSELKNLQNRYDNLSLTAVKRPATSTKNIQINNYIKNMPSLLESDIQNSVPMLTLEHHVMGAEGYAQYALEFPFKDKIVCVDVSRNKIKYKNEDGDIIEDVGFKKMMTKLCSALKDRSFSLCQEHYEKLSEKCTESEMDAINFMETALAITKYANGRESDFCKDIVKMISKGVTV